MTLLNSVGLYKGTVMLDFLHFEPVIGGTINRLKYNKGDSGYILLLLKQQVMRKQPVLMQSLTK